MIFDRETNAFDEVLFGYPFHVFHVTRGMLSAIKKAAKNGPSGKPVATFETYIEAPYEGNSKDGGNTDKEEHRY
ncbi:MAG: hypothetical protein EAX81_00855 [Candidatus Thorarchaeota archaeon]|nr:hypothetical protein [Candidatus Thorarchaeota archaeon]